MQSAPVTLTIQILSVLQVPANQGFSVVPGQPVSFQLQASGGVAPYVWGVASGSLPTGLSISPSGLISGVVPIGTGPASVVLNLTVSDSSA